MTSARPSPSRSRAVWKICGFGFPTIVATRSVAYSSAAMTAPVPGERPSSRRVRAISSGRDHLRPAQDCLDRAAEVAEAKLVVVGDNDDVGHRFELGPVDDSPPRVGHVPEDRGRADHVGAGARAAIGKQMLNRGSDGHHLLERRLQTERPELAHIVLWASAGRRW